ncbi:alcohol dehydrogenase [Geomonas silvestris]|uniref:Alcohol dehydrogenase n=1 Tax=Geomonas silvestris TaxID=2740184 RepID=A0A6V8MGD0_9BACT|nr:nucleotidyltransferase family protein [Geomonas silvestris]GFO59048.1 alcohol dehydrogenase [Geomonas silvestris]
MSNWESILVAPQTPIIEVIRSIDETGLQIALVVSPQRKLLGTLTDGDVRRAILKGIDLNSPVELVMNDNPIAADLNDSRESILAIMKATKIRQIPVVDSQGLVTGLELFNKLIQPSARENVVILMAGGLGNRLRPLTNDCPKPLLKVGSKPILETILQSFAEYGFRRFYIAVNYRAEMIKHYFGDGSRWGVEIDYLHEEKQLGTAGPLGLLPEKPTQPLLVMNGDLLTRVNFQQLLEFHSEHRASATMCVREYDHHIPYGVVKLDKHRLTSIEEKPVQRFFVNAGIYVLSPEALEQIPSNERLDMPDVFKGLIHQKRTTAVFPIHEYWLDIGRMDDFERADLDYPKVFNGK